MGQYDQPDDTIATRMLRAEAIANRADSRSREALQGVMNLRESGWSKDQHQVYVRDEMKRTGRDGQRMRLMLVLTVVAVLIALCGGAYSLLQQNYRASQIDAELRRIQDNLASSCEARNKQLEEQRQVYEQFIDIEMADASQPEAVSVAKVRIYQDALDGLPVARDCTLFGRSG